MLNVSLIRHFALSIILPTSMLAVLSGADAKDYSFFKLQFPGAEQTIPYGINNRGEIVGTYNDSTGQHGFVLERGVFTSIDVPFSGVTETVAEGINDRGQIVGWYNDIFSTGPHGFVLSFRENKKGRRAVFTSFDVSFPEATATFGFGINRRGEIIGIYNDSTGEHGFVATPSEDDDSENDRDHHHHKHFE